MSSLSDRAGGSWGINQWEAWALGQVRADKDPKLRKCLEPRGKGQIQRPYGTYRVTPRRLAGTIREGEKERQDTFLTRVIESLLLMIPFGAHQKAMILTLTGDLYSIMSVTSSICIS